MGKHVKGPRLLPRPYGPLLTATKRNEAVHWYYLYLEPGLGDTAFLLVVKEELTHFCEFIPCVTPTSFVAVESLAMWSARFGISESLLSDQGSHFRNEVVKHWCARMKVEQVFSPVYMPWLNGTVQRLNRDILQVLRATFKGVRTRFLRIALAATSAAGQLEPYSGAVAR